MINESSNFKSRVKKFRFSHLLFGILFLALFIIHPLCTGAEEVNKVVAIVNNEVITQHDVDQLLAIIYAQYSQAYKGDELLKKMEGVKKNILGQMIEDKLILSRAKELDVKVTEEEINDKLERIKNGFPSEELFYETLEAQGITVADLKNRYRNQIMMKKVVNSEVKSRVSVLPSEITRYYEKHRPEFKRNEEYKIRHILIKAKSDVDYELAGVEIENVYDKLKKGYNFSELAKKYSQGPNRDRGGDMGYIGRGQMLKELDGVIFSLKKGEFSKPVKSNIGYHIFKVEDIRNSGYFSLEEIQGDIKKFLFRKKFKERLDEWLAGLKSKAYISIK